MSRDFENDEELDAMLTQHLKSRLDPQLGRARLAFQTHVLATAAPARRVRATDVRPRVWMIGVVGTALAASMAALWAVPNMFPVKATPTNLTVNSPVDAPVKREIVATPVAHGEKAEVPVRMWEPVGSVVNCVSENQGVVLIGDNTPARVVREVSTESVQYVCPQQNVRVEIVVPRETTKLIPLETH
jgi:hypothetical protein